jgi:ADP-heptose:LPS heptosyltransferase
MIQVLLTWLLWPLLWLGLRRAPGQPARILVIQTAKIGDAICTSPLLRALREGLPDAAITVLAAPLTAPLFRNSPRVDAVIESDSRALRGLLPKLRLAWMLRGKHFDLALCCNSATHWPCLLLWAGIPRRVGIVPNYLGRTIRLANTLWTDRATHQGGRLVMETYGDMLAACGLPRGSLDKEVFAKVGVTKGNPLFGTDDTARRIAADDAELIGVAVSSGNKLKELGEDKLADVIAGLLARRPAARIVLLGTAADAAVAAALKRRSGADAARIVDACGAMELAGLPALLARLSLFVGVDSGLTYMADAQGIPLVSVAGPADMGDARPLGLRAVIIRRELPCAPCSHYFRAPYACAIGTRACIMEVPAADIVDAACRLLEGIAP